MSKEEKKNRFRIPTETGIGEVAISEEVIATIAALATVEVKGVVSMVGTMPNEIIERLGMKKLSKGVKIEMLEDAVCIDLAVNISDTASIPKISEEIQTKVKNTVETMTGYPVASVNIRVASVEIEGNMN